MPRASIKMLVTASVTPKDTPDDGCTPDVGGHGQEAADGCAH
jgi:hypothetical protein